MNNNNAIIALNEAEIDKIMLDIVDCSNKVRAIFNKIDDVFEHVNDCYKCTSATTLYNRYRQLTENYSIIINNIMSYNSDLLSLKKKYKNSFDDLSVKIHKGTFKVRADGPKNYVEER